MNLNVEQHEAEMMEWTRRVGLVAIAMPPGDWATLALSANLALTHPMVDPRAKQRVRLIVMGVMRAFPTDMKETHKVFATALERTQLPPEEPQETGNGS